MVDRKEPGAKGYATFTFWAHAALDQGLLKGEVTFLGHVGHVSMGPGGCAIEGDLQRFLTTFSPADRGHAVAAIAQALVHAFEKEWEGE